MRNFKILILTSLFFLCLLFLPLTLFAQEPQPRGERRESSPNNDIAWNYGEDEHEKIITRDEDVVWVFDKKQREEVTEKQVEIKEPLVRVPDRKLEIGLFNFGLGASNNFLTTFEVFREKVKINIDNLSDGFNINSNMLLSPVYINYNNNGVWGFGVSSGLDIIGVIDLTGGLLTFTEANAADSDVGAAVFCRYKNSRIFQLRRF